MKNVEWEPIVIVAMICAALVFAGPKFLAAAKGATIVHYHCEDMPRAEVKPHE